MKIHYNARREYRIKSYNFLWLECENHDYVWYSKSKQWISYKEWLHNSSITDANFECPCHSLRAAIRRVRQANVPKGTVFRLVHRMYKGGKNPNYTYYDIFITK